MKSFAKVSLPLLALAVAATDFKTFTPLGHFNDGPMKATNFSSPKHGAVIQITASELERLRNAKF